MKMSREQLYRRLDQAAAGEWEALERLAGQSPWRQRYHIQPKAGLLNDPNGFSYFEGRYHLFYQWFPLGTQHGMKYWYHTASSDLVRWENLGIALAPDSIYDSHGVFSGSAIEKDGRLYLMFTGNTRTAEWIRQPYQCLAVMEPDGTISKRSTPVISDVPPGYTDHFRDPKVWQEGGRYYCVIGAQRTDKTGCAVLYHSSDMLEWHFAGEFATRLKNFGYMWECPDYFVLDGTGLLLFSPQGLEKEGDRFQNIYQSGYLTGPQAALGGRREWEHGEFQELDRGFDFYAPQTTLAPDGRRLMTAWMGLPDIDYPTDNQGWAHCLCLPRELSMREGKLIQRPARELVNLRGREFTHRLVVSQGSTAVQGFAGASYELLVQIREAGAERFGIAFRTGGGEKTEICYSRASGKVTLDRSRSGQRVAEDYGTRRSCRVNLQHGVLTLRLYVDISSSEIFVNEGQEVFTARIFPDRGSTGIQFFAEGGAAEFDACLWEIDSWGGSAK